MFSNPGGRGGGAGAGVKNNLDVRFGILMVMN